MGFNSIKVNNTDTNYTHSIFDISEYNSGAIYANLSAALAAVPQNKKQGGMTVKFIQTVSPARYSVVKTENLTTEPTGTLLSEAPVIDSGTYDESQLRTIFSTLPSSTGAGNALTYYVAVTVDETTTYTSWVITKVQNSDNKYVQARCMAQNFTTDVNDWQGVDDEPIVGSNNLVKSGGVYDNITGKIKLYDLILPENYDQNNISDTYKAGSYCLVLTGNGTPISRYENWTSIIIHKVNSDTNTSIYRLSLSDSFTPTKIYFSVDEPFYLNQWFFYNGEITITLNEEFALINKVEEVNETLYENKGLTELFNCTNPINVDITSTYYDIKANHKYYIKLEGTDVHDVSPASWRAYVNVLYWKNGASTSTKLIEFRKGVPYQNTNVEFIADADGKLTFYTYTDSPVSLYLIDENLVSTYNKKIEELEDKVNTTTLNIRHEDINYEKINIASSWTPGYKIDEDTVSIVSNPDYKISNEIQIERGGIFYVLNNTSLVGDAQYILLDENHNPVYSSKEEKITGNNGVQYTSHKKINKFFILKQSVIDTYSACYMQVSVPSSIQDVATKVCRRTRDSLIRNRDLFDRLSNNGSIIRMSWFERSQDYSDSLILDDMYNLASMGAVLYLDVDNIVLDRKFSTHPDNLGKGISIVAEPSTTIHASDSFSGNFIIDYVQSAQTENVSVYDENGDIIEVKPIIKGGVYECNNVCGGIHAILSRGLLIEDVTVHNAHTYAISINTSPRSGYEYLVNKCRLIYDLYEYADNTGIGGTAGDSSINEIVVIGYHNAVILGGGLSNFISNVHGWIGWNYETQWENSVFIQCGGYVTNCYADTYHYGFKMNSGSLAFCYIFANNAFASVRPINELGSNVRVSCNNF